MQTIEQAKLLQLETLYEGSEVGKIHSISTILRPNLHNIVDSFYNTLMKYQETRVILENKIVEKNLPTALVGWLNLIFPHPSEQASVESIIKRHKQIGELHASINVSLNYLLYGITLIKEKIYNILRTHTQCDEYTPIVSRLFDNLVSTLSESYFRNEMRHESNELSMRVKGLTQNMAIECERMRSQLLDWLRSALNYIYQSECLDLNSLPKLQFSNFGLWVIYKLDLLTTEAAIVQELRTRIDDIDRYLILSAKSKCDKDQERFLFNINELNEKVTGASWYISSIVDQVIEIDTGLDTLTRLFNRRYLETVIRRQTNISMKQRIVYSVLLIDIDYFKKINDKYGHNGGDVVLKQFAELLLSSVRVSDFIFRYGGEEFLILGGNLDLDQAYTLAEKIRNKVIDTPFIVDQKTSISISCSIGISQHKGHPNYNLVIKEADAALYEAKKQGRNRTVKA